VDEVQPVSIAGAREKRVTIMCQRVLIEINRPSFCRWIASAAVAAALLLATYSCQRRPPPPDLPELPRFSFSELPLTVREPLERAYERARRRSTDPSASGKLGMLLHAHAEYSAAAISYQRARLLEPTSFRWAYYLGVVQAALGRHAEATDSLIAAVRLDPDYVSARLKLAEALLTSGRLPESKASYEEVIRLHPGSPLAHYGLGRVHAAEGQWRLAAEDYERACALSRNFGSSHYALAVAYRHLGKEDKAQQHLRAYARYKATAPLPDDQLLAEVEALNRGAAYYVRRGHHLSSAGRLPAAAAAYEKALEIDRQRVQSHVNLIAVYARLNQVAKVEEHYRAATQLAPNEADSHYNYGVALILQRRYQEAATALRRALDINPFIPDAHYNLASLLEQEGRTGEALIHYREAIANGSDARLAHARVGKDLIERKRYDEGIPYLLKAVTTEDKDTPSLLYDLAIGYEGIENGERALYYAGEARRRAAAAGQAGLQSDAESLLRRLNRGSAIR
jgi:tetratricopeptide (TPR) repeat protein